MKKLSAILFILALLIGFMYLNRSKYSDSNLADKYFYKHGSYSASDPEVVKIARKHALQYADANKFFKDGKYGKAYSIYNSLRINNGPYKEFAEWNAVMCKLKTEKKNDHNTILKIILDDKNHKMHQKAIKLNKDLGIIYRKLPF